MPTVDDILNRNRTLLPINDNDVRPGVVTINEQQLDAEKAKPNTATPVTPIKPGSNTTAQQQAAGTVNTAKEQPTKKTVPTQTASSRIDAGALGNNAAGANVAGKTGVTVPGAPGSTTEQTAPKVLSGETEGPSKELDLNTEKRLNGYKYDLMLNAMEQPETPEEKEQREKREKRERLFATIGDGLSAFHDAYSKARGVDSMIDTGISKHLQDRYDKLEAERNRRRDAYTRAAMMINSQRQADENAMENERYRNEMMKIRQQQQDRLALEQENKGKIAEAKQKYYEAMGNKNKAQADFWATKAELMLEGFDEDQAIKIAKARQLNAQADKAEHDANKPYSTGRGGGGSRGSGSLSNNPDYEKQTVVNVDPKTGTKTTTTGYVRRGTGNRGGGRSGNKGGNTRKKHQQNPYA